MKTAAALLAFACVLGSAPRAEAAGPPVKRSNAEKIVGTWLVVSVKGDKLGSIVLPIEFTKNGKTQMVMSYGADAPRRDAGTYVVKGDKLVQSGTSGGKAWKHEVTIKRLTASEMVWSYDGGKKEARLVPFKPVWDQNGDPTDP